MPTTPTNPTKDPENALITEIIKLNKTIRRVNSWWYILLRGILTSISTVVGVIALTAILGAILFNAAQEVNWNEIVQSALLRAVSGSNTRLR